MPARWDGWTLTDWTPPPGVIQLAYASRRGVRAAVRQLVDDLAAGFSRLVAEGRCLAAPG